MDIDPDILKQLYQTFSAELEEQCQVIVDSLLFIEKNDSSSSNIDSSINGMFRAAHTIKGAAKSISFDDLAKIAHALESLFSKIKNNELEVKPGLIDICLKSIDAMKSLNERYVNDTETNVDLQNIIDLLDHYQSGMPVKHQEKIQHHISEAVANVSKDSVRVDVRQLDKLSTMLDELSMNELVVTEYSKNFSKVVSANGVLIQTWKQLLREISLSLGGELTPVLDKLSQSTQDLLTNQAILIDTHAKQLRNKSYEMAVQDNILQEEFRLLRLVPAAILLQNMPRYVRELSHDENKPVELVVKGDQVRVDRMILDALKDPIIHLLRNAIDHGIESVDVRQRLGKPEEGKLTVDISDHGNSISIKVIDDGAGIDLNAIKEAAISKKIISKDAVDAMSEAELLDVMFLPGFTTKKTVTDVSGRGVGLDVVKSNLEKIKGSIKVESLAGKGTTFSMIVPLTLSSERGLMVKAGDQFFVLPTVAVERILRIRKDELIDVAGRQAISIDNQTYAVHLLANLLDLVVGELPDTEFLSAIIIRKNQTAALFLVDEIIGEREIVIKQLQPPLSNTPCIAGGTLGDANQVIVVLNPHDLIKKLSKATSTNRVIFSDVKSSVQERINILVVDDSITTRTLEKNILESKNYNVSVAVNGKEAWDYIQKKNFSLIITDVNMPVMDGFELTEKIKSHEKFKNIPVIIVTSLDSEDEKRKGLEVGANAYVVKNEFESGTLIDLVSQLV